MEDNTLFLHATITGDVASIRDRFLKNKTILAVRDPAGRTALHLATLHGHTNVVELLLNAGIEPSTTDNRGQTALHLAVQECFLDIIQLLLRHGANYSIRDREEKTPLFYAYQNYSLDLLDCFQKHTPVYSAGIQYGLTPEIVLKAGSRK